MPALHAYVVTEEGKLIAMRVTEANHHRASTTPSASSHQRSFERQLCNAAVKELSRRSSGENADSAKKRDDAGVGQQEKSYGRQPMRSLRRSRQSSRSHRVELVGLAIDL